MIRDKRIQLILFAVSILASILFMMLRRRELNFGEGIVKAFAKGLTDKAFLTVFLFGWVLLVLANIFA
jgi:hypothetical protein